MPTCDDFEGRLRDICRGHDEQGRPVLTRAKCAAYRKRWIADGTLSADPDVNQDAAPQANVPRRKSTPLPPRGQPGTELKRLLDSLGLVAAKGCDCAARVSEMNRWGVAGCREHREEIVAWLSEQRDKRGWMAQLVAAGNAVLTGVAFRLNPLDPLGSLVDEAIRRAEIAAGAVGEPDVSPAAGPPAIPSDPGVERQSASPLAAVPPGSFYCAVTSAPRQTRTLLRTIDQLITAGFSPHVFAEPGTELEGVAVPVTQHAQKLGAWKNWRAAAEAGLASCAEFVLLCQDDIVIVPEAKRLIDAALAEHPGEVVTAYVAAKHARESLPDVSHEVDSKNWWGALCCCFPADTLRRLLATKTVSRWKSEYGVDDAIGIALRELKVKLWGFSPSLADHADDGWSALWADRKKSKKGRNAKAWRGGTVPVPPPPPLPGQLTIIIPARDCADLTTRCLTHVRDHASVPCEVLYVDDGSQPGTVDTIAAHAESIGLPLKIHRMPESSGFTKAVNAGIAACTGDVLLLNNDAFLMPGCLPELVRQLEENPQAGAVGPLSNDRGQQSLHRATILRAAGLEVFPEDADTIPGMLTRRHAKPMQMLTGFCCLKRRTALVSVGLLDESPDFPHGLGTDDDWCLRARRRGWQLLLCYGAFCQHLHSESFKRHGLDRTAMQATAMKRLRNKETER